MRPARVVAGVALLASLAVLSSDGLTGQDKDKKVPEPAKKAAKGVPAHWDKLDLTDAQREELAKLYADYLPKRQKLLEEMNRLDAELARKRVGVLNDEQRKKLVEIATADLSKEKPDEKGNAGPPEKEKPKGKVPDK